MSERIEKNGAKSAEDDKAGALRDEANSGFGPRIRVLGDRAELLDSKRSEPRGIKVGPSDPNAEITVTVMVKSKASDKEVDQTLQRIIDHKQKPLSDAEFNAKFGADPNSMARVLKFANDSGLKTEKADASSGRVVLKGTVKDLSAAFGVQMDDFKDGPFVSRERSGNVSVPKNIAKDVQGVFGLDNRRQAEPHFRRQIPGIEPRLSSGYMPNEVADAYKFPKSSMGKGQSVGIIELGGGLDLKDNAQYYKDHNLKEPTIQLVGVDGATNSPGNDADGEVALDTQVIGAVAPEAKQQLIFAPNSEQGFVDAITRATFAEKGEIQNTAISISWGAPESGWTDAAIQNMNAAFKKAALKGISVFAASGDNGSKDSSPDGKHNADYPSSDPFVTGTGGTRLDIQGGKEVTWNDGSFGGSTGGGISSKFDVPDFQKGVSLPANANTGEKAGRGDPDVAGDASPTSGYRIRVNGSESIIGGTSAVAPLYAALMMRVNGSLKEPAGYLNPFLYKNGSSGIFRDITDGNNGGYNAGPGWDAATGWGSIRGDKFLEALKKAQKGK